MYLMTACYQCDTTPPNIIIKDLHLMMMEFIL